jgi:hypothetical protein
MIEFITNIYIFPIIGVLLGLFIYHFYHKVDDKNYLTKGDYFKCAVLIYIVCFAILFLQQNMGSIIISNTSSSLSKISNSGTEIADVSSVLDDVDNVFNTGHPGF